MSAAASGPAEQDGLAAEYVLGTLEAWQSGLVERSLPQDPALRGSVEAWEGLLWPLAALAPAAAPPMDLWNRIDAAIEADAAAPPRRDRALRSRGDQAVRWWAIGASLAAAVFAAVAFVPRTPPPRLMTVLVSDRSQPAWTAEATPGGALRVAAVPSVNAQAGQAPTPVPAGRVRQLWALPSGATAPTSLGLLPTEADDVRIAVPAVAPAAGMLIEITLEPAGGSPTGRPTGPVLFIGRLVEARPS